MDNKILELLLNMQSDMKNVQKDIKDMQSDIKDIKDDINGVKDDINAVKSDISGVKSDINSINNRLDRLEFKVNDGFETLELLSENNSNELNRVKVKVSKLENRIKEINTIS